MYSDKAEILYNSLLHDNIIGAHGKITISLLNIEHDLSDKSSIGNILQEWLGAWMKSHSIYCRPNPSTQQFPDFFLSSSDELNLLEVKTFDYAHSPNFDIANFDAYVRSIYTHTYRLNADYLIIGYSLNNTDLEINQVYLKKIWEIAGKSPSQPLKVQNKQGKIVNIRPRNFKLSQESAFRTCQDFLYAIFQTLQSYEMRTIRNPAEWYDKVLNDWRRYLLNNS